MQTEVKEIGPCKLSIKIEVPQKKVKEKLDEKYKQFLDTTVIPGFRKGKAPRSLVERKFGKDINNEVKTDLIGSSYEEVLKEKSLSPIGEPEIDYEKIVFDEKQPLNFDIVVEVHPTIDLKEYTGIKVKKATPEVTDTDMKNALENLRRSHAELVVVENEPVKEGDLMVVDQEVWADDKQVTKKENISLEAGPNLRIFNKPASEEAKSLIGMKPGETRQIKVKAPDDYKDPALKGKDVLFKVTLKEIKRVKLPGADDRWAKTLKFDSLKHLKDELNKRILSEKEKFAIRQMENNIIEEILKKTDFPMPEGLVKQGLDYLLKKRQIDMHSQKIPEDKINEELEKTKAESKETVVKDLKIHFILEHIARKEKIFVTEDEVGQRINEIASAYRKWPQEIKTYYERNKLMGQLRSELKEGKVRKLLREKAVLAD